MAMTIQPVQSDFVGEVSGIDLTRSLSRDDVAAIEAGMDRYAVLVFHDQPLTDEQQCAFSRNFGELEVTLIGQLSKLEERRLGDRLELGDISNLDAGTRCGHATTRSGCMRWPIGCGIRMRHSARMARNTRCCTRA